MIGHQSPVPSADVRKSIFNNLNITDHWVGIRSVLQDYRTKVDPDFKVMSDNDFKLKCTLN
jgi:hypothetical protein